MRKDAQNQATAQAGGLSDFFDEIMEGLAEGVAYARAEIDLKVTRIPVPEPPPVYDGDRIRSLRARLGMSQPFFSRLLNVSLKTVQSWEQGVRIPGQSAARLLQIIEDPQLLAGLSTRNNEVGPGTRTKQHT